MLIQSGTQRHLVVLDDEDGGETLNGSEVDSLMEPGRLGRPISDPAQDDPVAASLLEGQSDTRGNGDHVGEVRNRREYSVPEISNVPISPTGRRVRRPEVTPQHV